MLKAWQPVPTLTKTIILFFILSAIFLGVGIPMMVLSSNIREYSVRYDQACGNASSCLRNLEVGEAMDGPIFVYYQLHNYYQNHRLYAKSISYKQLKGDAITVADAQSDCDPIIYNGNITATRALDGTPLNPNEIANPCGIIAYSIFNDSFSLTNPAGNPVPILSTGIAWPADLQRYKLGNISQMWYNTTDERFINWIRIASMADFRKLWGRI